MARVFPFILKTKNKTLHVVRGVGCASGVGLPPAALSPNFLDKRVGTGPASA